MQPKTLLIALIFSLLSIHVFAQSEQVLPITLQSVLQFAGADNLSVKEWQQRYERAVAAHKFANEWWVPTLYGGFRVQELKGADMNTDGNFFLDLNVQNVWAGAGLNAEFDLGKGVFGTQAAREKATAVRYRSQAEKNNAILEVVQQYFNLQAAQAKLAGLREMMALSSNIATQLEAQTEAGLVYKSDLLLAKSNLNHQKIALRQQETELKRNSSRLTNLLNIKGNSTLLVADTALVPVTLIDESKLTAAPEGVYNLRPEFRSLQSELLALQKEKSALGGGLLLPTLRLGVSDGAFGDLWSPTGRDGNPIDKLYNTFEFNGALLWRVPLNEVFGGGRNRLYKSDIIIHQNKMEQVRNQVREEVQVATAEVLSAKDELEIAREGLGYAREALSQSIERQKLRTAKAYEVFQAQEYFMRAQMDFIDAIKNYNQAQYRLYVALGNNL